MKRKLSWHFYAVSLIVLNIAMTVYAFITKDMEYSLEISDLQAMRNAEISAEMEWDDNSFDELKEYWYDAMLNSLIPINHSKPAPYGVGTRISGGSVKDFTKKTGHTYNYNESESYEGKILSVSVYKKYGNLRIEMKWVNAD